MAHSFTLLSCLKEARNLDIRKSRHQSFALRRLPLLTREEEFVRLYRLSEALIDSLEDDLRPILIRKQKCIPMRTKILCTLSFLANGTYQKQLGRNINTFLSQASASRCICEVVEALNHPSIVKKHVRFPQNAAERQILITRFYEKFNIPGVLGCIDGTFVAMIRPAENEERYYSRKGYHARNVQLVTDADLNILHVDASYGGATHDSFIFNNSELQDHMNALTNNGQDLFLLGDSGYALRRYMMVPVVPTPEDDSPEAHYNKLHASARNSVERTIGILKGRFRCLLVHRVLHYHPDMVAKIVIACCVLHNICNRAGVAAPVLSEEEAAEESGLVLQLQQGIDRDRTAVDSVSQAELTQGLVRRTNLISRLWRARHMRS